MLWGLQDLCSPTRHWTHTPCSGSPNPWTAREVPLDISYKWPVCVCSVMSDLTCRIIFWNTWHTKLAWYPYQRANFLEELGYQPDYDIWWKKSNFNHKIKQSDMIDNGRLDLTFHMDQNTRAYKWNYRLCCPLCPISFSEHVFRVHWGCAETWFFCMAERHSIAWLCFPVFSDLSMDTWVVSTFCEQCCYEHLCTSSCLTCLKE